jgi:glycerate kinase
MASMRVVAAPDKLRGTASARAAAEAVARAATAQGWDCEQVPMADGGEGTLDALGGPNRVTLVTGPLGAPVEAGWRLDGRTAVIEMAAASGLELIGGAEDNDPIAASTAGTGELIAAALEAGATRIIVGVGGSATTDGGLAALRAMHPLGRLRGVELVVACDVRTSFVDAADAFAPQKGATPAQVALLRRRLERLAQVYQAEHGVDVTLVPGAGAAGSRRRGDRWRGVRRHGGAHRGRVPRAPLRPGASAHRHLRLHRGGRLRSARGAPSYDDDMTSVRGVLDGVSFAMAFDSLRDPMVVEAVAVWRCR